jgi:hypothetical protein
MVYGNTIRKLNLGNAGICGVQKICFITLFKDVKIKIHNHKFTHYLDGCETCCLLKGKNTLKRAKNGMRRRVLGPNWDGVTEG